MREGEDKERIRRGGRERRGEKGRRGLMMLRDMSERYDWVGVDRG